MDIMPPPDPSDATLHAHRMARVDGCPNACGNYTPPTAVRDSSNGYHADYTCEDCGHTWTTAWSDKREWGRLDG